MFTVVQAVLALRETVADGAEKLRVNLSEHHPALRSRRRARSAIGCDAKEWLTVASGAVVVRLTPEPFAAVTGANDVGAPTSRVGFRTGDGRRCDPFTLSDAHSRYLLPAVRRWPAPMKRFGDLERRSRSTGLRGDPFGQRSAVCLARGGACRGWRVVDQLGIRPERIVPASRSRMAVTSGSIGRSSKRLRCPRPTAFCRRSSSARGILRSLQPRAAARSAGATDTGLAVPALAAS